MPCALPDAIFVVHPDRLVVHLVGIVHTLYLVFLVDVIHRYKLVCVEIVLEVSGCEGGLLEFSVAYQDLGLVSYPCGLAQFQHGGKGQRLVILHLFRLLLQ